MRHRGRTQTVSFRMSGKALDDLEREAKEFGISLGELSRAVVDRYLKNHEFRAVLEAIEAIAGQHGRLAESLAGELAQARSEIQSLRRDFNRAVGRTDESP